jgi:anthocyanidin reductase
MIPRLASEVSVFFVTEDDMEKNSHLKDLQAVGPLEVIRAELNEEGSFDDAVSGCDYAFLVAAPMNFGSSNPEVSTVPTI